MSPVIVQETSESAKRRMKLLEKADQAFDKIVFYVIWTIVGAIVLLIVAAFSVDNLTPFLIRLAFGAPGFVGVLACPFFTYLEIQQYRELRKYAREMDEKEALELIWQNPANTEPLEESEQPK